MLKTGMNSNKPHLEDFTRQKLRDVIKNLRTEYDLTYGKSLEWIRSEYEHLLGEYKQSFYYDDLRKRLELTDKDFKK